MPANKKSSGKNVPIKTDQKAADFLAFYNDEQADYEPTFLAEEGQLSCDVYQDKDNIYIKTAMAGVEPEDLDISINGDLLTIRGIRDDKQEIMDEDYFAREIYWGVFSRSIVLPQEINQTQIEASLKNGILTITLPKKYKTTSIKVTRLDD